MAGANMDHPWFNRVGYGDTQFSQWQLGQQVTSTLLKKGDEVCFSQAGRFVSMKAYESDGVIVADVPNRMLEIAKPILVSLGQGAQAQPSVTTQLEVLEGDMPDGYKFEDNSARELKRSGIDSSEVTQIVKDNFEGGVGYEETTETVMLPETSFEVSKSAPQVVLSESFPYTFEIGKEYTVTFDGVTNTYTAIESDAGGVLTNTSVADVKAGNGWGIQMLNGQCLFVTADPSLVGAHTISISGPVTKLHRIDSKYVPIKALWANSSSKLYTGFDPVDLDTTLVPLTYEEAYSLYESCCSVYIFTNNYRRYTVTEIRGENWDVSGSGFKHIYFDVMDGVSDTVKTFSVANPNYSGVS